MTITFSDRTVECVTVEKIDDGAVTFTDGWSYMPPAKVLTEMQVNGTYLRETKDFGTVTGMATLYRDRAGNPVVDRWLFHKTEEDLAAERQALQAQIDRKHEQMWAQNQQDWREREAALPAPLRQRLDRFRANGGHQFEVDGWGYELVTSELAVLYAASGGEDSAEVTAFARQQGTSGNQHDFAKALARAFVTEPDTAVAAVAALAPVTGNPDYTPRSTGATA